MNLLEQVEADNEFTLEDLINGFGRSVVIRDSNGMEYRCAGQVHRVGVDIDPETGLMVPGNKTAVTVRLSAVGVDIEDGWICETTDSTGNKVIGRITSPMHDKVLGRVTFMLRKGA